jgi:uncharacterized membrane protein YbhN (UPF0104 family)
VNPNASSQTRKDLLKLVAKAALGGLLIYYVLHSNMVNFHSLTSQLTSVPAIVATLVLMAFAALCCSVRWHLLVKAQGLALSLKDVIELTMIGNFFNSFMPGSVGGDLIKAWYAAGQVPKRKTRAVFTVLLDRVLGLGIIVACAAVTLACHASWLVGRPELKVLALGLWGFTGVSLVAGALFFASGAHEPKWLTRLWALVHRNERLGNLLDSALLYRHHLPTIFASLLLSSCSILSTIVLYKFQGDHLGIPLTVSQYFFIIPVALTVSAVPVLPGGFGVGQVAFFKLFQWVGAPNPADGATLCTLLQIFTLLFNCTGAIFYLKFKRKPAEDAVSASLPAAAAKGQVSPLL